MAAHTPASARTRNRSEFLDAVSAMSRICDESETSMGLMLVKLSHLRDINHAYGFDNGDRCLAEIAQRLSDTARPGDVVGHMGGGLFGVLLGIPCEEALLELGINRMLAKAQQPVRIDGESLVVICRAAGGIYPDHAKHVDRLLADLEALLHQVFIKGRDYALLESCKEERIQAGFVLVRAIESGLDEGQFTLRYQPQIHLRDGRIAGLETLIRWQHPEYGKVSPERYVSLAEKHEVIVPLTRWIFNTALREFGAFESFPDEAKLSINLSAMLLSHHGILDVIGDALAIWGVDPTRLMVEITETSMMQDEASSLDAMGRLRDLGCRISIDDFGTGYSSLAYLERLPVDELKIDKSFILSVTNNEHDLRIVRAIIDLAHIFEMRVVAEGVEDAKTQRLLGELGCDIAQGYHIAQPLDLDQLVPWLAAYSTRA